MFPMVMVLLSACASTNTDGIDTVLAPVSCEIFEPIRWSSADTKETLRQIAQHNAAWEENCSKPARVN